MSQQAERLTSEQLIDQFVTALSEVKGLDQDVIALIQRLHQQGRLNSKSLLQELAKQREVWEHDTTS